MFCGLQPRLHQSLHEGFHGESFVPRSLCNFQISFSLLSILGYNTRQETRQEPHLEGSPSIYKYSVMSLQQTSQVI